MDAIRQGSSSNRRDGIIGFPVFNACLLLWLAFSLDTEAAHPEPPAYVYAIQLESSRKPNLDDYKGILDLGTLYTYQDKKNKALTRVRMGYYPHRKDAAVALEQIRKKGFPDAYITRIRNPELASTGARPAVQKVTPPKPAPKETAAPLPTRKKSDDAPGHKTRRYIIQLESSRKPNMADFDDVRQYGELFTRKAAKNAGLTYVRLGTYDSLTEARQVLTKVKSAGFHDAYIIRTRKSTTSEPKDEILATPAPAPASPQESSQPEEARQSVQQKKQSGEEKKDTDHLYAIHVTTTEDTDMSRYDIIRPYGVVYMSYRYSRKEEERNQIRIMAGYYDNHAQASSALEKIRSAGFPKARIVQVPDRSKVSLNRRITRFTTLRPRPQPPGPAASDAQAASTKQDPFLPPLRLDSDPFGK